MNKPAQAAKKPVRKYTKQVAKVAETV